jgi:hypothetical protein
VLWLPFEVSHHEAGVGFGGAFAAAEPFGLAYHAPGFDPGVFRLPGEVTEDPLGCLGGFGQRLSLGDGRGHLLLKPLVACQAEDVVHTPLLHVREDFLILVVNKKKWALHRTVDTLFAKEVVMKFWSVFVLTISVPLMACAAPDSEIPSREIYWVQLASVVDGTSLSTESESLAIFSNSSRRIVKNLGRSKLQVGKVADYADAYIVKLFCRAHGWPDAFIVSEDNVTSVIPEPVPTQVVASVDPVPNLRPEPPADWLNDVLPNGLDARTLLSADPGWVRSSLAALASGNSDGREVFFDALAAERSVPPPFESTAYSDSITAMGDIASGRIRVPSGYRIVAARQYADMLHYSGKNFLLANIAYRQILQAGSLPPEDLDEVRAHLGATHIELFKHDGKGHVSDAKRALQKLRAEVSPSNSRVLGTFDLMIAQLPFFERKYDDAVEQNLRVAETYGSWPHLKAQAYFNVAYAKQLSADLPGSQDYFLKVVEINVPIEQSFHNRLQGGYNITLNAIAMIGFTPSSVRDRLQQLGWDVDKYIAVNNKPPRVFTQIPGYGGYSK